MSKRVFISLVVLFWTQVWSMATAQAQLVTCDLPTYQGILSITPGDMALKNAAANLVCNNVPQLLATHTATVEAGQAAANQAAGAVAAAGVSAAGGAVGAVVGAVVGAGSSSGGGGAPSAGAPSAYLAPGRYSISHSSGASAITSTHSGLDDDLGQTLPSLERSIWVRGLGGLVRNRSTASSPSSKADFYGVMSGGDFYSNDFMRLGLLGVVADINVDVNSNETGVDVTLLKAGLTSSFEISPFYLDASLIYGPEITKSRRYAQNIKTPENFQNGVDSWMTASYTNQRLTAAFETGMRTTLGSVVVQPLMGVKFDWIEQAAYTEQGHQSAAISNTASSHMSGETKLGVILSTAFFLGDVAINPSLGGHWTHRFGDLAETLNMSFDKGANYQAAGSAPLKGLISVNAGLNINVTDNLSITSGYAGSFNRTEAIHTGTFGLKLRL